MMLKAKDWRIERDDSALTGLALRFRSSNPAQFDHVVSNPRIDLHASGPKNRSTGMEMAERVGLLGPYGPRPAGQRRCAPLFSLRTRCVLRSSNPAQFDHVVSNPRIDLHASGPKNRSTGMEMAERVGFEPTWDVSPQPISSRCRYGHFGTSPGMRT